MTGHVFSEEEEEEEEGVFRRAAKVLGFNTLNLIISKKKKRKNFWRR
jgi:hypothetical protein